MGDRLMAGRQTLDLSIGVRIPVPQPIGAHPSKSDMVSPSVVLPIRNQ